MANSYGNFQATRRPKMRLPAWILGCLSMTVATSAALAQPGEVGWRIDSELYLTGMGSYRQTPTGSTFFNTVAATAKLNFSSLARPYYGGFFTDYRTSGSASVGNSFNIGGFFRYDISSWDVTTWLFASKPDSSAESWIYAGRLRYRLAEKYKVGIEVTSSFLQFHSPAFAVGYYASLSDSLSLNIIANPGIGNQTDVAARIELAWRMR